MRLGTLLVRRAATPASRASRALARAAALAHGAQALAVRAAPAAGLLALAETLRFATAAAARLVLLAEATGRAGVAAGVEALGHDLALVDPDLDADAAEGRLRLGEAVVDVRTQRVQRDAALGVGLRARHLRAAEAAAAGDLHALRAGADRRRERALHRTAEAHAILELLGDRLCDELRVELGALDLVDVDVDVLVRHRVHLTAQRVDLGARLPDDDAGARGEDVDRDALLVLLDEDVAEPGMTELAADVVADLDVLDQVLGELLRARVPVGLPFVDDTDA